MARMELKIDTTSRGRGVDALKRKLNQLQSATRNMSMRLRMRVNDSALNATEDTLQRIDRVGNGLRFRPRVNDNDLNDSEDTLQRVERMGNNIDVRFNDNGLDDIENRVSDLSDRLGSMVGAAVSGLAGIGLGAIGMDFDELRTKISTQLGVTGKQLDKLETNARNVFKTGSGGRELSVYGDTLIKLKKEFNDLNGDGLESMMTDVNRLAEYYDTDTNDIIKQLSIMSKQFKISGQESAELLYKGFASGLNRDSDLDVVGEFSTNFARAGYSAEDMFNKIISGSKNGIFMLENIPDALNELESGLNTIGKDADLKDMLAKAGLSYKDIYNGILQGGDKAKQSITEVITALSTMTDLDARNQLGQTLFASFWDDKGSQSIVNSLADTTDYIGKVKMDLNTVNQKEAETFKQTWDSFYNTFRDTMQPIAQQLLKLATDVLKALQPILEVFGNWLKSVNPDTLAFIVAIGAITSGGLMLFKVFSLLSGVFRFIGPLIVGLVSAIGWEGVGLFAAIAGIITVATLLYKNWGTIWTNIQSFTGSVVDGISSLFDGFVNAISSIADAFSNIWTGAVSGVQTAFQNLLDFVSGIGDGIKSFFSGIGDFFHGILDTITSGINSAIKMANDLLSFKMPDWLGGGQVGVNIPTIGTSNSTSNSNSGSGFRNNTNVNVNIGNEKFGSYISNVTKKVFGSI